MNYPIFQGETLSIYHVWYDINGIANDLSTWSGEMHIYDRLDALLATITLTTNVDGEIEGSADSSAWALGAYSYYIRLDDGAGRIVDLISGRVCIELPHGPCKSRL